MIHNLQSKVVIISRIGQIAILFVDDCVVECLQPTGNQVTLLCSCLLSSINAGDGDGAATATATAAGYLYLASFWIM
ncbi:hypothetical protein Q3G72_009359 [Acer saccharum]|nr:hypothetical protein Q3G72_009359 [Acer saccharum]